MDSIEKVSDDINQLFELNRWADARKIIEAKLLDNPKSHWYITQLGVTYYEEREYKKALKLFFDSLLIISDCPLTVWYIAGALCALGDYERARTFYKWILKFRKSPNDDPCWESEEWAAALQRDAKEKLDQIEIYLSIPDIDITEEKVLTDKPLSY